MFPKGWVVYFRKEFTGASTRERTLTVGLSKPGLESRPRGILCPIRDLMKTLFGNYLFFFRGLVFASQGRFSRYLFLPFLKGHFRTPLGFGREPQPRYTRSASGPRSCLSFTMISSSFRRQSGQIVSFVKNDNSLPFDKSASHRSQKGWIK